MPVPDDFSQHPSPAQVYELGVQYATLLGLLANHPQFKYLEPPTAEVAKIDALNTPVGLLWVNNFVETTYVKWVIPFLPPGATRKCKALGNPWAQADADYPWEWTWDAAGESLRDASGTPVPFPDHSGPNLAEHMEDISSRGFMTKKLILENETDPKARLLLGGSTFDFGPDIKALADVIP
jgi:hypothetical protein